MQSLILLDDAISSHLSQFIAHSILLKPLFIVCGVYLVYLVPIILAITWFSGSRKDALRAFIAGILAWEGLSKLVAHFVHRTRPGNSQIGTTELVFHRPDTSFPSDHSAFLMAIALSFYLNGQKRLAYWLFGIAIIVGIARVGIGVHFPGDILGGWIVGSIMAVLIQSINQPLEQYILEPVIKLLRKVKL